MKLARFLSIPILSVLFLVGVLYYVTVFIFIDDWLSLQTSAGSLNALIFTFFASLCIFSYFVCVLKDPGTVPSSYVPDVEENQLSDQESGRIAVQAVKCDKCLGHKPPRAHHCRVCKRCILRMDHHCLWINNCVGHKNYKSFVLLVFYATVASTYSSIMLISSILDKEWEFFSCKWVESYDFSQALLRYFWGHDFGLTLTLGTLLSWHIYLIAHNMTTIEYYAGSRAAWLARKSGVTYRHAFDVGTYKNITLVLGPNMLKWLCPTAVNHVKDGLTFPTLRDNS
nr:probable protein S-acyltransferase 15 [Ipomoea batatas]